MAISSGGISGAGSNGEFEVFSCNQSSYLQFVQNYAVIDWWTKQWVEYESETSDLTVRELFIVSENYKLIIRKQSRLEIFQLPTQYNIHWEGTTELRGQYVLGYLHDGQGKPIQPNKFKWGWKSDPQIHNAISRLLSINCKINEAKVFHTERN